MMKTSTKTRFCLSLCLVVLAVVFATLLVGSLTVNAASTDVFQDVELRVGDKIGFVYYTSQPYTATTTMKFEINGRVSESDAIPNNGTCVFIFNDIYPHELNKEIKATIYVDGKATVTKSGLSVKQFLLDILADANQSANMYKFASDLLQYGEQTRLYRNANVAGAEKDDESITDFDTTIYTRYQPTDIAAPSGKTAQGLGVSASSVRMSSIGISYYNVNQFVVTISVPTNSAVDTSKICVRIDDKEYNVASTNTAGVYEVRSEPINAFEIAELTPSFELYVNNVLVQQATYSCEAYIAQLEATTDANSLAQLYAKSLYAYGRAAKQAYAGKSVIAISLINKPQDFNVQGKGQQTVTGGSAVAYYSDGSTGNIDTLSWSAVDGITDDTYQVTRTTTGSYTDHGKTYTVTAEVTLRNPMTSAVRYTDPTQYSPSTFVTEYQPTGAKVKCTWSNGYEAIRDITLNKINMTNYKSVEYAAISVSGNYTCPKSSVTKTVDFLLYYENPITKLEITGTKEVEFNAYSTSATPKDTKFKVTYQNGVVSNDIESKNDPAFKWSTATYTGTNTSGTLTNGSAEYSKGLSYGKWTFYSAGTASVVSKTSPKVSATCNLTFSNPEKYIAITTSPAITIRDANSISSTNNNTQSQITGGTTTVYLGNGKSKVASNVTYTAPAFTGTDYSKTLTVTASYNGLKNSSGSACTTQVTAYNKLDSITQSTTIPQISASGATAGLSVSVTDARLKNSLIATYENKATQSVTPNNFVNGTQNVASIYISNITDATEAIVTRKTGSRNSSMVDAQDLKVNYTDTRTGASKTVSCVFSIGVYNKITGFASGQTKSYTLTSDISSYTPTGKATVTLSNGSTQSVTPTYSSVTVANTAAKSFSAGNSTMTYTSDISGTITGTIAVTINNPVTKIECFADPKIYQVPNTSAISEATAKDGCLVHATFTNGGEGNFTPDSISGYNNAKLGSSSADQFDLTATYGGQSCPVKIILKNPIKELTVTLTKGTENNPIILQTGGVSPSFTAYCVYQNGAQVAVTDANVTIYSSGTTSNTGAIKDWTGSTSAKFEHTWNKGPTYDRRVGTTTESYYNPGGSVSATKTVYWKNNPKTVIVTTPPSVTVNGTGNYTPPKSSGVVTLVCTNGYTHTGIAPDSWTPVEGIDDTTYEKTRSTQAVVTRNDITIYSARTDITYYNYVTSFSVADISWVPTSLDASTFSMTVTGTAKYLNGVTAQGVPVSITNQDGSTGKQQTSASQPHFYIEPDASKLKIGSRKSLNGSMCDTATFTFTATYKAAPKSNGKYATDDFTFTINNQGKLNIYRASDYAQKVSYITDSNQDMYVNVKFNTSSQLLDDPFNHFYPRIEWPSGETVKEDGFTSYSWPKAPSYTYSSNPYKPFLNGTSYSSTEWKGNTGGSLQQVEYWCKYKTDIKYSLTFYCVPCYSYVAK